MKKLLYLPLVLLLPISMMILSGNKVKFCDIENKSYGLSYESLKKSSFKKTKAVILMHYSGSPARDSLKYQISVKKIK